MDSSSAQVTKKDFDGKLYTISGTWEAGEKKGEFTIQFDTKGSLVKWESKETP